MKALLPDALTAGDIGPAVAQWLLVGLNVSDNNSLINMGIRRHH